MNPSDLIWPLLGAVVGTAALSVVVTAIFQFDLEQLSAARRISALGVSALLIFTIILVANGLARPNPLGRANPVRPKAEGIAVSVPVQARADLAGSQSVASVNIFAAEADAAPLPEVPPERAPQAANPNPESRPARMGELSADDVLHYRDYRGDHYVRLGDAKIVKKGALYFLDLGTIAGLPNQVKISDNDQAKARKWLVE